MPLLLALLVFVMASGSQASTSSPSVDEFIDRELPASGAPGVAYAIVHSDEVRSGARGTTLAGSDRPLMRWLQRLSQARCGPYSGSRSLTVVGPIRNEVVSKQTASTLHPIADI
jgi:hypothetical protein